MMETIITYIVKSCLNFAPLESGGSWMIETIITYIVKSCLSFAPLESGGSWMIKTIITYIVKSCLNFAPLEKSSILPIHNLTRNSTNDFPLLKLLMKKTSIHCTQQYQTQLLFVVY
jgi:uncharacterized membrane protein